MIVKFNKLYIQFFESLSKDNPAPVLKEIFNEAKDLVSNPIDGSDISDDSSSDDSDDSDDNDDSSSDDSSSDDSSSDDSDDTNSDTSSESDED
jgi:hypothetical protein